MSSQKTAAEETTWMLNTGQNGCNNVEFWASSEMNFIRKTCILEAEVSESSLT